MMQLDKIVNNLDLFLGGAWMTVQLTVIALLIGFCIALPCGLARARRVPIV